MLVVGAGASGAQIAEERHEAGRGVYLSVGKHSWPPRRYRGKDFGWWLVALGRLERPRPCSRSRRDRGAPVAALMVTGARSGHDIDLRAMAAGGMVLLGALTGFEDGRFGVAADLAESFATADDSRRNFIKTVDDYVTERGLDLPRQPEDEITPGAGHPLPAELSRLDPTAAGIRSIVWCPATAPTSAGWSCL